MVCIKPDNFEALSNEEALEIANKTKLGANLMDHLLKHFNPINTDVLQSTYTDFKVFSLKPELLKPERVALYSPEFYDQVGYVATFLAG